MRLLVLSDLHIEFSGDQPSVICLPCGERFAQGPRLRQIPLHSGKCDVCSTEGDVAPAGSFGRLSCAWAIERELPSPDTYDAVVLAGDIGSHTHGLEWAARVFAGKRIVYVAGNHELYGAHAFGMIDQMRQKAAALGIVLLENDEFVDNLHGVRFLGCVLWTDFKLHGDSMEAIGGAMQAARRSMPDFSGGIQGPVGRDFMPADSVKLHEHSKAWLAGKLREPFDGPTVVVTHHLPSARSVATRYAEDPVAAAFASRLDNLVAQADLWIHGHTHDSFDYQVGGCRVVCNPRGYPGHARIENERFKPTLIVEASL